MLIPAAIARLNQYTDEQHFQNVMDQIVASQQEGLNEFELDVKMLDEDEISDILMALEVCGYVVDYLPDEWMVEVRYE